MLFSLFISFIIAFGAVVVFVPVVFWYILQAVAYWRVFVKAGEAGWKSLIPIYNTYTQFKISWNTGMFWLALICAVVAGFLGDPEEGGPWYYLAVICSVAQLIINFIASYKLARSFGYGIFFALGLYFLNPIFLLILGFGSSRYSPTTRS